MFVYEREIERGGGRERECVHKGGVQMESERCS